MKKNMRKAVSLALSSTLLMSAFSGASCPFTAQAQSQGTVDLPPVIMTSTNAQGNLDLTQLGGMDWFHMRGDHMERKAGTTPILQMAICDGADSPLGVVEHAPVTYSWSDGTTAAADSDTAVAAFSWKKGQENSVGMDIEDEVGYTITVPASDFPQVLTVVTGLGHAEAKLLLHVNGEEEPVYTDLNLKAGEPAYTMYTINIRQGNRLEFVYRLSKKNADDGCVMLGAAALNKLTLTDAVKVSRQEVNSSNNRWNLTEMGDLDWLHLSGTTSQDATSQLVQTRKADVPSHIQFEALQDTSGMLVQNDNAVGYSWNAADASSGQQYSSAPGASKGLVLSWKNGDSSSVGDIPENLQVGGRLFISANDSARNLTFVAGAFQSKSIFSIYLNGSDEPAYQSVLEVGEAATNIYTVKLSAGDSALIELRTIQKRNAYGNLFLGGIALGVDHQGLNLKADLSALVEEAEAFHIAGFGGDIWEVFRQELAYAKTLLTEPDVSNERYYEAKLYLQDALNNLIAYTETMSPDFYSPNTRNWLYFGWENDAAKSLSTMGGTLYPGGANGSRNGHIQPIRYTVSMDGTEYKPDETSENRGQHTRWYQADGYMNSPVSEWRAGDTGMAIRIQHVANRVLENRATVVFTQVILTNTTSEEKTVDVNISAPSSVEVPLTAAPTLEGSQFMVYRQSIPAGKDIRLDFAALATGTATAEQLKGLGDFQTQYAAVKTYYDGMLDGFARPVSLPDQEMVNSYLNSMIVMWETMVQVENGDYEIRGDAGNRCGVYNYDRYFSHDVPNMVEQFIRDGYIDLAKRIMESSYYQRLAYNPQQGYLDAIPKYIIPYATLWQVLDADERAAYFTDTVKSAVQKAAQNISTFMTGPNGLMAKSNTLDNGNDYLVVDNFAVMHGYAAYAYLCNEWGWADEAAWADERAKTVNDALNRMLDESMERRDVDWYMGALEDSSGFWTRYADGSVIYDGNWLGTTFMMSTFPWDAVLRGYDLGGTWADYLDASLDNAFALKAQRGDIPDDSWGAWWGHEYGAVYNVGMSVPLLYSETYRTMAVKSYEWMLDNQSAPFQWGESFDKGQNDGDWTKPAAGYETWGLGFMRQGLLEATASVKTDGTVIVGRGIPNEWLTSSTPIEWENIAINDGRRFDTLKLYTPTATTVKLELTGDNALGDIVLNLSALKNNIAAVSAGSYNNESGTVTVPGNTKELTVTLKRSIATGEESAMLTGITAKADTTVYRIGDTLDKNGLTVTAHYEGGSSKPVTTYSVSALDSSTQGIKTLTVTYTEEGVTKSTTFEVTVVRLGDVDDDGDVSAGDALLALQASTAKIALSPAQIMAANVDGVDAVTAADALLILQYSTQKISRFPAEA